MGVHAIDQTICPQVLGKARMLYCPRTIEHFGLYHYQDFKMVLVLSDSYTVVRGNIYTTI